MNRTDQNINDILRQKFENFEPQPPVHIWENIEKSLDAKSGFFLGGMKYFVATLLLLAIIPITYFGFYSGSGNTGSSDIKNQLATNEQIVVVQENDNAKIEKVVAEEDPIINNNETLHSTDIAEKTSPKTPEVEDLGLLKLNEGFSVQDEPILLKQNNEINSVGTPGTYPSQTEKEVLSFVNELKFEYLNSMSIASIYSFSYGKPYSRNNNGLKIFSEDKKTNKSHWENTIFISPEFSLTNLDSVTILNSYSIGVEPSRYFNENWFMRFGLNISFSGDKGFAKIDYISNDLMGTYDDVYDVTFDTINGVITPNYHTKTVEVWDSIRHIVISEVSNKYLFAQIPALLGYKNKLGKLNWYVFGGPAIGFQITKWIDDTGLDGKDIEIINLNRKLPLRSAVNYQIWIGGGIEYKLGRNSSFVIEPLFKHYFKSLYSDVDYKVNTSSFAFRIGFNYKIRY